MSSGAPGGATVALPPRLRYALFALLGLIGVTTLTGAAFAPYLLVKAPLLLVALAPEGRHIILAVSVTDPVYLVGIATARRLVGLIAAYGLGVNYGPAAVAWAVRRLPSFGRIILFAERLFARVGTPLLLVVPLQSVAVLAGASGTRFWAFLLPVSIGQFGMVLITFLFGDAIAAWTRPILAFLSDHLLESTLVCVLLVALQQGVSLLRRRRRGEPAVELPPTVPDSTVENPGR